MTDRRPDVHCSGCGVYCYSLSADPRKREYPETHHCPSCESAIARGVRSGEMQNHAWLRMTGEVREQFQKVWKRLGTAELGVISSFVLTMHNQVTPDEKRFKGDPHIMTVAEWQELARVKLARFKKGCNRTQFTVLNNYIKAAENLNRQTAGKAA